MAEQSQEQREVTDDDLKAAVKEYTPAGTQEIADAVGMTRQGVDYRLQKIEERHPNPCGCGRRKLARQRFGSTPITFSLDKIGGDRSDRPLSQTSANRREYLYETFSTGQKEKSPRLTAVFRKYANRIDISIKREIRR